MPRKPSTTIRITDEARSIMAALAKQMGISQAAVMEIALRKLYQQEKQTMSSKAKFDYRVVEDNGGGLHLYLMTPGTETVIAGFDGFEYTPSSLVESLNAIDNGDDTRGWDGRKQDAQADWDSIAEWISSGTFSLICYSEDGQRTIKPERMGRAGQLAFGIKDDE